MPKWTISPNCQFPWLALPSLLKCKPFKNELYQKKKTWGWVHTFLKPLPFGIFRSFFHTKKLPQNFVITPLGSLWPETKTPGNSTFLVTSENSTLFLTNPWNFFLLFLQYPWEFHILYPPFCFFFWNSPMKKWLNYPL